jgi:undecaprenyl-diphosphatase
VKPALRLVPWNRVVLSWLAAFATGAVLAAATHGAGWWEGAAWEARTLTFVHQTVGPTLDIIMLSVPFVGTNYTLAPVVAIAAFILARRGHPIIAIHLLVVQIGSWLLNPLLKFSFPRDRPTLFEARGQHAFPAFPSGHAVATVAVLFTVAWLIHRYGHGAWGWWLAFIVLALNAWSRIYLAVHWPTDVVAGVLIGAVWLLATIRIFAPLHASRVAG